MLLIFYFEAHFVKQLPFFIFQLLVFDDCITNFNHSVIKSANKPKQRHSELQKKLKKYEDASDSELDKL
ncbi:hypothetical protein BLOT_004796 [Blomia tropicalis]|nr:hypothetical protein BLOT_004796 [Blomia tropicalis]